MSVMNNSGSTHLSIELVIIMALAFVTGNLAMNLINGPANTIEGIGIAQDTLVTFIDNNTGKVKSKTVGEAVYNVEDHKIGSTDYTLPNVSFNNTDECQSQDTTPVSKMVTCYEKGETKPYLQASVSLNTGDKTFRGKMIFKDLSVEYRPATLIERSFLYDWYSYFKRIAN